MKRILIIVILLILSLNVFSLDLSDIIARDKILHYSVSFGLTEGSYVALRSFGNVKKSDAIKYATISVAMIGVGKEVYDCFKANPTGFSYMDLVFDGLGIATALVVINNTQE